MSKAQIENAKIKVPKEFIKELATQFKCSRINVYNSLSWHNNSELAVAIRESAAVKLQAEAKKVK